MPYETDFDTAFTILLGKAQGTGIVAPLPSPGGGGTTAPAVATSYMVMFHFGGGGSALAVGGVDPLLVEVPDPGEIVWAHMYAGNANGVPAIVTATIELHVTRYETYDGRTPVYGSGNPPSITADTHSTNSLVGWVPHLDNGALLVARLTSFTGSATWCNLALKVRRDYTPPTQLDVIESGTGNTVLDGSGNAVVYST